jgi:hypothetical protein
MNPLIDQYIIHASEDQTWLMNELRKMIHLYFPAIKEDFKWGRPVFSLEKDEIYFKCAKTHLTLGFFHAEKLKTQVELLEGSGKDMRHIKLKKKSDLNTELIKQWFDQIKA